MVVSTTEAPADSSVEMELDLLEEKIMEAASLIEQLRGEKKALEQECDRLRGERAETVGRLSRLLEKVDSIGGEE